MFATHQTSFPAFDKVRAKPNAQQKRQQQKRVKVVKVSASSSSSPSELDEDGSNQALLSRRGFSVSLTVLAASFHPQNENVSHARNSSLPTVLVIGSTGQTGKLVVASLANANDANVIAGCRSLEKAKKMKLDQNGVELLGGGKRKVFLRAIDCGSIDSLSSLSSYLVLKYLFCKHSSDLL